MNGSQGGGDLQSTGFGSPFLRRSELNFTNQISPFWRGLERQERTKPQKNREASTRNRGGMDAE